MRKTRIALVALIACGCAGGPSPIPEMKPDQAAAAEQIAATGQAEEPEEPPDEGGVSPEHPDSGPLEGAPAGPPAVFVPKHAPAVPLPPVPNDEKIELPPDAVIIWDRAKDALPPIDHPDCRDGAPGLRLQKVALRPGTLYILISNDSNHEVPRHGWYMGTTLTPEIDFYCGPAGRKMSSPRVSGAVELGGHGLNVLAIGRAQLPQCKLHIEIRVFGHVMSFNMLNSGKGLTVAKGWY